MRLIIWAFIIAGLIILLGCQSAGPKDIKLEEGATGEFEIDTKQTSNSTFALVTIPLGLAFLFLLFMYLKQRKALKVI